MLSKIVGGEGMKAEVGIRMHISLHCSTVQFQCVYVHSSFRFFFLPKGVDPDMAFSCYILKI